MLFADGVLLFDTNLMLLVLTSSITSVNDSCNLFGQKCKGTEPFRRYTASSKITQIPYVF